MSISKEIAYFKSSTQEDNIYCKIWRDKDLKDYKGILQIIHGTFNHIDCFDELGVFFAEKGYIVCGNDNLGSGKSGSLGCTCEKDGDIRIVDDMHLLTRIMKNRFGEALPYFILGDSTGSFIARNYCSYFSDEINGAVFSACMNLPDIALLAENTIDKLAEKFGLFEPIVILKKPFTNLLGFDKKGSLDFLTKDKKIIEQYKSDYLCSFNISYSYLRDLIKLAINCSNDLWAKRIRKDLPIFLIGGAIDSLSSNGNSVISVCDRLCAENIIPEVILYPDGKHDILHETNRDTVYKDLAKWLEENAV
ncbi:MAG: lysophospholipase [Clostridiales bacterium]|nr:lysophospholipase [Clostridiales bacterium]